MIIQVITMKKYRYPFLQPWVFLILVSASMQAQQVTPTLTSRDSAMTDSAALAQQLMQQHAQQALIDSMIRVKLNEEMATLSSDSKRKQELEAQLAALKTEDSLRQATQLARIKALKLKSTGFPVHPFDDTLFYIYTKTGSFKAQERAAVITKRLKSIYKLPDFDPDSLVMTASDGSVDIVYGKEQEVMSITALDAMWHGTSQDSLATQRLAAIKEALTRELRENSVLNWLQRIGLIVLILAAVVGLIVLIRKLFAQVEKFLHTNKDKYFNGLSFRNFKLFGPEQHLRFAIRLTRWLRGVTIVMAIYFTLPLLFSVFPDTKMYANTLIGWVLAPARRAWEAFIHYIPSLFTIGVTYLLTRYAVKAVGYFARELEQGHISLPGFHQDWAKPTFNIVKFLMYAFMVVIIFPYLPGSDSPAFQGISVFLGVLLSLGSSSAITNVIAGLVITYMRPFKIGDRVRIGEVTGDILEKTMLVTRIRTIKNEDITVPNATVLNSHTINYSANAGSAGLILNTTVTIGYDVSWRKMHEVLIAAALRTEGVLTEPGPFVLQTSLDDFYVSYQINAYTREAGRQAALYSELHQHIQDCCNEAEIEILSPHYRALRDGNMVTIPAAYLPRDYQSPVFRVQYPISEPHVPARENENHS